MARHLWTAWGIGAAGLYIWAVVATGTPVPVRLLYDGYAPPAPYRWVHPPLAQIPGNSPPQSGEGTISLTASGSSPGSVVTGDAQAGIIFPQGTIETRPGETYAVVKLTPLDPATMAPAPPSLRFDGNAYRVDAVYARSRTPIVLRQPATMVLLYPTNATDLLLSSDSGWTVLKAQNIRIAFQIFAPTQTLGVFVAAGPPHPGPPLSLILYRVVTWALWIAVAVVLVFLLRDFLRGRRRSRGGRSGLTPGV